MDASRSARLRGNPEFRSALRVLRQSTIVLGSLLAFYAGSCAWARTSHHLVMWDGYQGGSGVSIADIGGPQPRTRLRIIRTCEIVFCPAMKLETALRPGGDP